MINRRHIRIKVMQSAYAMLLSENDNLNLQEKHLLESMEKLHLLYVLQFKLLIELQQRTQVYYTASANRYIPSEDTKEKRTNFLNNRLIQKLKNSKSLSDYTIKKGDTDWKNYDEVIQLVWNEMYHSKQYEKYIRIEQSDFYADKKFIQNLFKDIIAPSIYLDDFYEGEVISWIDDIPFVNTWVLNTFKNMEPEHLFVLDPLYKDMDDRDFGIQLLRKTILNFKKYEKELEGKTPNWEADRITKIDKLLMVMAITEFLNFPSIPTKVSINEYIELAKDYSTQKSSVFINGVLDKLVHDFDERHLISKSGRGLL